MQDICKQQWIRINRNHCYHKIVPRMISDSKLSSIKPRPTPVRGFASNSQPENSIFGKSEQLIGRKKSKAVRLYEQSRTAHLVGSSQVGAEVHAVHYRTVVVRSSGHWVETDSSLFMCCEFVSVKLSKCVFV
jgi:hypothetical protein